MLCTRGLLIALGLKSAEGLKVFPCDRAPGRASVRLREVLWPRIDDVQVKGAREAELSVVVRRADRDRAEAPIS